MQYSNGLKERYKAIGWNVFGLRAQKKTQGGFDRLTNEIAKDILVDEGAVPVFEYYDPNAIKSPSKYDVVVSDVMPVDYVPTEYPIDAPSDCPKGFVRGSRGVCQPLNWSPPPPPPPPNSTESPGTPVATSPTSGSTTPSPATTSPTVGAGSVSGGYKPMAISGGGGGGARASPATSPTPTPEAPQEEKKPMDKKWWIAIGVVVLVLAVGTTYFIAKS